MAYGWDLSITGLVLTVIAVVATLAVVVGVAPMVSRDRDAR